MMQSVMMNAFCIGVIYARLSRALVSANPSGLLLDARPRHSLQQEGSDPRDQWRVVLHVPNLRETKAPAHREPRFLLLC